MKTPCSERANTNEPKPLRCPECGEEVWDGPRGHKLAKCWNTDGHESGDTLAFDTMPGCATWQGEE